MKVALDPYMFRRVPLTELPGLVADLGYECIELSPRADFLPFFVHPRAGRQQVAAFRKALSAAGVRLVLEPHPDDFIEDGRAAIDLIRGIDSGLVSFLYCAPHTFHQGGDIAGIMRYAGPLLTQVHIADSFDHRASSGLRYIVNPPGGAARVHQHLDIGQGEVDWDLLFRTLADVRFDGIATACVFAWEERARGSSLHNQERIRDYFTKHGLTKHGHGP
jgi:sugar phosphate isomerase/epimerase